MLHRMTLRVLPALTLAVTQEQVRKRKRIVMLVPGLVAFVIYRVMKQVVPLSEPLVLLGFSGLASAITALWAYHRGRGVTPAISWREDGPRRLAWLTGWIGFAYGTQLSLMVLALLEILAHYDFLRHQDGPAMMAVIIACTSVARDAFEIGHVRLLQRQGEPVVAFPDGGALRALFSRQPGVLITWALLGGLGCIAAALGVAGLGDRGGTGLAQLLVVSLWAGSVAVWSYLAGEQGVSGWRVLIKDVGWGELFRFWWWPGLAFAATYYLTLAGAVLFVLQRDLSESLIQGLIAGLVAGLMALDGYYLGHCRRLENQLRQVVPAALLRCPFVVGILSKSRMPDHAGQAGGVVPPVGMAMGDTGKRGGL